VPGSTGLRERTIVQFLTRSSRETPFTAFQVSITGNNCSVFYPVSPGRHNFTGLPWLKSRTIVRYSGAASQGNSNLRSTGRRLLLRPGQNCEQLFGFLTSKLLTASDSGSGRASGRGRGRTCSVSDFQTSRVQVKPPKNCEQFQKKR